MARRKPFLPRQGSRHMNYKDFCRKIESRIYIADVNYETIRCLCYDAREYGMHSVQVFPNMAHLCVPILKDTGVRISALNAWSYNGFTADQKGYEAASSIRAGADDVQTIIMTTELKSGHLNSIDREMKAVREAVPDGLVYFCLEIEYLNDKELENACILAVKNHIDYLVTSTGYFFEVNKQGEQVPFVTTVEEIQKIRSFVGNDIGIMAQGNVLTAEWAEKLMQAGTDLIATRAACRICNEFAERQGANYVR